MRDSVKEAWPSFITKWEGREMCMYLDALGIVTCAGGIALFTPGDAVRLQWQWVTTTGQIASQMAVQAEWARVKSLQGKRGAGGRAFEPDARLQLTEAGYARAMAGKLADVEAKLTDPKRFPNFAEAPADAQLALLRMAWAMGPAFVDPDAEHPGGRWPAFHAAFLACDWMGCAGECRMREEGQPEEFRKSNDADVVLFHNACWVWENEADRDTLYWPRDMLVEQPIISP